MQKRKIIRKVNQIDEVNWPVLDTRQAGISLATWAPIFQDYFEGPSGGRDILWAIK